MVEHGFEAITAVMLAGGRGQRLGGIDKGLQLFAGQTLASQVLERVRPQVGRVLISANRNQETYASFGHPVIGDLITDYAGPLAGLHSALTRATTELVLTVPCDTPKLPLDLAARLFDALNAEATSVAVVRVAQRMQPTFCLVRRSLLESLETYLTGGGRKMAVWLDSQNACYVDFDDQPEAFFNINTPEDLAALALPRHVD